MPDKIAVIAGEGFGSSIFREITPKGERVWFLADGDIDADGANGQNGARPAYTIRDDGSEALANGGMKLWGNPRRVIAGQSWAKDIVVFEGSAPKVYPGGVIVSKTAYVFPGRSPLSLDAYLDSETVPYGVVPPVIIQKTDGIVKGCKMRITNRVNGKWTWAVVGDVGPRNKIGEVSIEAARRLGINPSPRSGGTNAPILDFELWPSQHGEIAGRKIPLMTSTGQYRIPA